MEIYVLGEFWHFVKKIVNLKYTHNFTEDDLKILKPFEDIDKLRNLIDNHVISVYMSFIIEMLFASNKYFNDQEPWKKKNDKDRLNTIVYLH